jgi:hypothetical protein
MNTLILQFKKVTPRYLLYALGCFVFCQQAQATPDPAPGQVGGLENTADGQGALPSVTGAGNSAFGVFSLLRDTTGSANTAVGAFALSNNLIGNFNTAVGSGALTFNKVTGNTAVGAAALNANTTGIGNTALGAQALQKNDADPNIKNSGSGNTAVGAEALANNTIGLGNTAVGVRALKFNNSSEKNESSGNTAVGAEALLQNTTGKGNTGVGARALKENKGSGNTAVGAEALRINNEEGLTSSNLNTAVGTQALELNTDGSNNTAVGAGIILEGFKAKPGSALGKNTEGNENTAVGGGQILGQEAAALGNNTIGKENTAVGNSALSANTTGSRNTAIGRQALSGKTTGDLNIALGANAGCQHTSGDNNIDIGSSGVDGDSNTIRIGTVNEEANCAGVMQPEHTATYIAGIFTESSPDATEVFVNADGKLGTVTSSARFKDEIKPMDKVSEAILALKPVSFHYKKEIDPKGITQFGLVAEEVEKVNPDLVVRDQEGKPYTVRYDAVNAMLLNEFLKEHRKVEQLEKQVEALTAGLQKVSAQREVSKPAPQTVANNQ